MSAYIRTTVNSPMNISEPLENRLLFAAAPQVSEIVPDNRGRVEISVTQDLAPATVNANSVSLYFSGPDQKYGTADDVKANAAVSYDAANRMIIAQANLPAGAQFRIVLDADRITNTSGIHLDGEFVTTTGISGDGTPGGNFDAVTRAGSTDIVRFWTESGRIDVRLFDDTPLTNANFLQYANSGAYDRTIIHRSVTQPTPFVIQGGGYFATGPQSVNAVAKNPPVQNEPFNSNVRGTIAMAKVGGDPNSATNEWFFNLGDNSGNLDMQNGGFTAFGEITNAEGLAVMDALAGFPTIDMGGAFTDMPVRPGTTPQNLNINTDAVDIERVSLLQDVVPTNPWRIGAVADFNNDGHSDVLWHNYASGMNVLWYLNNGTRIGATELQPLANPAWELVGAADFDNDNDMDLVWRNRATGQNTIWLMEGRSVRGFKALPPVVDLNWSLAGVADFDGDGNHDLIWRNYATGLNSLWFMDGQTVDRFRSVPPVANLNFRIGAVVDLNNDNKADIVFRETVTGRNTIWLMNENQIASFQKLPNRANTHWSLVGGGQFDNRPGNDLLWSNSATRAQDAWGLVDQVYTGTVTLPSIPS